MVLTINNLNDKIILVILIYCISIFYKHNSRVVHDRQTLIQYDQNSPNKQKNEDYFAIIKLLIFKFKII